MLMPPYLQMSRLPRQSIWKNLNEFPAINNHIANTSTQSQIIIDFMLFILRVSYPRSCQGKRFWRFSTNGFFDQGAGIARGLQETRGCHTSESILPFTFTFLLERRPPRSPQFFNSSLYSVRCTVIDILLSPVESYHRRQRVGSYAAIDKGSGQYVISQIVPWHGVLARKGRTLVRQALWRMNGFRIRNFASASEGWKGSCGVLASRTRIETLGCVQEAVETSGWLELVGGYALKWDSQMFWKVFLILTVVANFVILIIQAYLGDLLIINLSFQ
jgi:hypothetical protein